MKSMKVWGIVMSMVASLSAGAALADSPYCREYTRMIQIGGQPQQAYGTACMQPDGSWQEVTEPQPVPAMNQPQTAFYPVTPAMQAAQPRIPYDYSYAAPVAAVPVIMPTRTVYRDRGTSFSISFGDDWRNDPYYVHGRYYNPIYWDKHWAHHRKHYKHHDDHRGRGRGHGRH